MLKSPQLARYPLEIFDLLPLHRWDSRSQNSHGKWRDDGKRPLHANWTKRPYDSKAELKRALASGHNLGVRLRSTQLVIDVDPRNGGAEGFKLLCDDLLIDPTDFDDVTAITGSGGFHVYLDKPGDVPILDTLEDYPGVEFKSVGRQVVAAGSRHPNGKFYRWKSKTEEPLKPLPCPANLLSLITRPQRDFQAVGGGQIDEEQAERILEQLDPTEFSEHDTWLHLMMAFHHASAGAARDVFVEWSISDPNHADQSDSVGRRWDSLHEEKNDGYTFRHINHVLRERKKAKYQISPDGADAAEEFAEFDEADERMRDARHQIFGDDLEADDEDDWLEAELTDDDWLEREQRNEPLRLLNKKYCAVMLGGKFRIATQLYDDILNRKYWSYIGERDFKLYHCTHRIERDTTGLSRSAASSMKVGDAWVEWPGRRQYEGVVFAPGLNIPDKLNLFEGWAVKKSRQGSWKWLRELIEEVIANGNQEVATYILNWLRFMFQRPMSRAETAVVMQGGKGVGKGTLGNVVAQVVGQHALAVASPELVTGRFNSHLQNTIFLFADEAIRPYDTSAESRLKNMITEPVLAFEAKGVDVVSGANLLHVMMATNEQWAIPASMDERRFLATMCNTKWQKTPERFDKLWEELKRNGGSGLRRFLFDMLTPTLPKDWHPRQVPVTQQLVDQKIRSLTPLGQWLFEIAEHRVWPFPTIEGKENRAFFNDVRDSFELWCRGRSIKPGNMGRGSTRFFLQELQRLMPMVQINLRDRVPDERTTEIEPTKSDGRAPSIQLPDFPVLRIEFCKHMGHDIKWTLDSDDEFDFG